MVYSFIIAFLKGFLLYSGNRLYPQSYLYIDSIIDVLLLISLVSVTCKIILYNLNLHN